MATRIKLNTNNLKDTDMKTELLSAINKTFNDIAATLKGIENSLIDTIPFEGSWSIGQVAEHLIKAGTGIDTFMETGETTQRPPDQMIPRLKSVFLDLSIKMETPDFIKPTATQHEKEALIAGLEAIRNGLIHAVETMDLTQTCTLGELPTYGFMTRLEWAWFVVFHTTRHTNQMKNIHTHLLTTTTSI